VNVRTGDQKPTAFIILPRKLLAQDREGVPAVIEMAVAEAGYEPLLDDPQRPGAGSMIKFLVNNIVGAQVVIIDLTGFDPYVLCGLGIAMTLRERVILLLDPKQGQLPDALSAEFYITYANDIRGAADLRLKVKQAVLQDAGLTAGDKSNTVYQSLPEHIRVAIHDPTRLTRAAPIGEALRQHKEDLVSTFEQMLGARAKGADMPRLEQRINQLSASLDQTGQQLRRLVKERDTMLAQMLQSAYTLEAHGTKLVSQQDGAELMFVPPGLFVSGPPAPNEEARIKAERFVRAFYMDRFPVTNAQFTRFVQATGYVTIAERLNAETGSADPTWHNPRGLNSSSANLSQHPVVQVYRADALAYAHWAGRRLPTRWEWERAARGVTSQAWPWGERWDEWACNLNSAGTTAVNAHPQGASLTGCWDMAGNVWEWTADVLPGRKFLLLGGSWAEQRHPAIYKALVVPEDGTDAATGFRCAMDVPARAD
jgi:formylglycine-generating enzyme required for sulfatase activity